MAEDLLDIGEVARVSGVAPSALRFYEKRGLLASDGRNGLRRTYRVAVLDRLALIVCARTAGFTVAEIARFLASGPGDVELKARMATRARELDDRIAQLTRMRDSLRHAAGCDHEPLVECPDFAAAIRPPESPASGTLLDGSTAPPFLGSR
ncbi:MerR family transcriptional regulator [Actinocorallia herbida]|uniref:MerR family transcriptional regulator n=1 Tax=Actinocorallia herbida TaxID=58109 RepID=A0A3N1CYS1_9ACTN|nr:MerR family transcriptional regulator [Actinocorallia herbida]ROO86433.1 MerR family transcriptional regulator [Actinocorallia herbida]